MPAQPPFLPVATQPGAINLRADQLTGDMIITVTTGGATFAQATLDVLATFFGGGGGGMPVQTRSVSVTMTGAWVRIVAEDSLRQFLDAENVGANNIGFYRAPTGNNNAAPAPAGIGSLGVNTIVSGGSYGGQVVTNELWAIGTIGDVLTVFVSV